MKIKIFLSSGLFVTFMVVMPTGCNLQKSNPLDVTRSQTPEVPVLSAELITFEVVKTQVLEKHCFECHSRDTNKGGVQLETYANVLKEVQGIRDTVFRKSMPPRRRTDLKLSDSQIKLIIDWIDAGAKEFGEVATSPPVVVNPPTVTPPVAQPPVVIPPIVGDIYFEHVNEYVIKTNCVGCHSEARGNKGDVNLESYAAVLQSLKEVKDSIVDGFMPPKRGKPLTEEQKKLILNWIDAGAKEAAPVAVTPPPEEIRFTEIFDQVLVPYCLRCHSEQGHNEGDLNLETYENVVKAAFDIKSDIEQGFMPPKRSKQMTPEQKKMILDWLAAGAKE